jgi:Cu(I)/Ag(I) efflux system membrane fusion protein
MKNTKAVLAGAVMLAVGLGAGWSAARLWTDRGHGGDVERAAAASAAGTRKVLYWYDPMVPSQRFDKPGKSPFMDMQLVPRYADEAGAAGTAPAAGVSVSPQAVQALGVRVAVAERRALAQGVDVAGTVGLNERDVGIVHARANGFVERVYARAPGDVIAAGAPLVDVLHPEWLAAQGEFLSVRQTGDAALTAASRQRLGLLGMPAALVERVERSGRPEGVNTITAPIAGQISELMVRQGMTVSAGMTLARINGLAIVWVEAAVPEVLAAAIRVGQGAEVRVTGLPGEVLRGKVGAVLPEANRDSRTLRVRVELPNPGLRLRAGMFAQVALRGAAAAEEVVVPAEAVIRTGRRALVYVVDAPGRYRPVEVEPGAEVDGRVAIRRGLAAGQQVVASGQFLIDSEASLQGVMARAEPAPASASTSTSAPTSASASAAATAPAPAVATPATASAAGPEFEATGTVSSVEPGGITLDHAPVPALKWPAMTMPFQLSRPDLARGLKPGDAVRFRFRQQGDEHIVTAIQRAPAASGDPHAGHAPAGASAAGGASPANPASAASAPGSPRARSRP